MTWIVRPYAAHDCAACWQVYHRAIQIGARGHYDRAQRDAWSASAPRPSHENCARLAGATTLVAQTGDDVIGFMSLTSGGHLDLAFVDPAFMGRGVASDLHDGLLRHAHATGLRRLTTAASHLAHRFLARRGWRMIERETVTRSGVSIDRFRMDLQLEPTP